MHDPNIERLRKSYKEVPYLSQAYPNSHPERLATLGKIFNMSPAPVTSCRILELGCASGGNIIPMAYFLPESEFVGIELAEGHAESGKKTVTDLGLKNINIQHGNILDVDASLGLFDYIICHGVFSWVPESVQEKILSITSENLTEQGVAYISYNTYPGWHMREMIRHMMLYHASQFDEPEKKIGQAKAFIDFLAGSVGNNTNDPYALLLKNEIESLKSSGDWYIFHDYMEVVNTPIYFHQFIERAGKHDLQYLADASFSMMFHNDFSEEVNLTLENVSHDIIQKEQYMDFLRNRQFRQTLLCKKERELKRNLDSESLTGLLVSSATTPETGSIDLTHGQMQKFQTSEGRFIETDNPVIKASLKILKQHWPRTIPFEALLDKCVVEMTEALGEDSIIDQDWKRELGRGLLHCFASSAINLNSWQGKFTECVSSKPKVSDLTIYQLNHRQSIVNQRHETVNTDALAMHLIPMLDGTKNKEEMLNHLTDLAENKTLTVSQYDLPLTDPEKIRQSMAQSIDNMLLSLAHAALLIA
ncbi:MAG: methyltransferase domain-containing protein [Desulfobacteraceae bacterium]|nr:methyltransferase regulatory domain-containing protein [Desulfobacteraceae bacterium]MBC2754349.1 methyltransferase domain-containing protein [Desulfobacteraceae bacterium]